MRSFTLSSAVASRIGVPPTDVSVKRLVLIAPIFAAGAMMMSPVTMLLARMMRATSLILTMMTMAKRRRRIRVPFSRFQPFDLGNWERFYVVPNKLQGICNTALISYCYGHVTMVTIQTLLTH